MKRPQDKIKDYVEPQAFDEVQDVAADPARALAAYRFTDATSDLLARWLDALADLPRTRGAARALAGARGVGKSHSLAVFGALVGSPELRASVNDTHVTTSARRLVARRYTVVRVERGLRATLVEEMVAAFTATFGGNEAQWGTEPMSMLAVAAARAQDSTLVVVIDTAFDRRTRVGRDDGPVLARLAAATQTVNAFVALALDDDIADASGVNSVLARSYAIDYLDPEHLYRVADQYLLRKNPQARAALHDIYLSLRTTVPGFNWSEPRFLALYPVHPLVADVAAAVRLFAPKFGFLPFAAGAAARAVGRPALSLILLDEVFDRAERDLRAASDLKDAFAAYDEMATKSVARFPVMQRLQAKLILKSLFIYSLDGRGATASELCAALLLSDENTPQTQEGAVARIGEMLAQFAELAPARAWEKGTGRDGGEIRYRFQISASAKFEAALAESVENTQHDDAAINDLLRSVARSRFKDWPLASEAGEPLTSSTFHVAWRGSERPGSLVWLGSDDEAGAGAVADAPADSSMQDDWRLAVIAPLDTAAVPDNVPENTARASATSRRDFSTSSSSSSSASPPSSALSLVWRPARLKAEELTLLRRLLALQTDAKLLSDFADTARAAASTLGSQAERIWTRVYLDEGMLDPRGDHDDAPRVASSDESSRHTFSDEARAARTLSAALEKTFAPLFEKIYPRHPVFAETLGERDATALVNAFAGNAGVADAEVNRLAAAFAAPLGLAVARAGGDNVYTFETGDESLGFPWVSEVLALTDATDDGGTVSLDAIRDALRREPYGLLRDARRLVLAGLVAQRQIELVTASGDRVSRRTLDGSVNWDDVAGVCRAASVRHNAEELTAWARLLTSQEGLAVVSAPPAREAARDALAAWLEGWRARRVIENFNALPDGALTTRTWGVASAVGKSFGAAAAGIEAMFAGDVPLEEALQRVADAFGDAPENFTRASQQLEDLSALVANFDARERARVYLSLAEATGVDEIESARRELLQMAEDVHSLFDEGRRGRFDLLWEIFHARYADHYAAAHDEAAGGEGSRRALEELLRGDLWREFEALSHLSILSGKPWREAEELLRRARGPRCDLPARQVLQERPACACGFRLARAGESALLAENLAEVAQLGHAAYRRTLVLFSKQLQHALDALAAREENQDGETASRARALANGFSVGIVPERFSRATVRLLERATADAGLDEHAPPLRVKVPNEVYGLLTREELAARLAQWLDDLPDHSAFIEVAAAQSETDGA